MTLSDKKTGGPAFPVQDLTDYQGMTLRDYFAAHAPMSPWLGEEGLRQSVARAYRWADAMLAERER